MGNYNIRAALVLSLIHIWMGKGKEDEDGRSYWIDLLTNVLGMDNVTERLNFEKKVVIDGNTKRIDAVSYTHLDVYKRQV